ncbi:MAG: PIN domain-containing protein [Acidobacteriota bacterium]
MMVLVDTSVWSLALRRRPGDLSPAEERIVATWAELVRWGRVRMIGPIRQELLSWIRSEKQFSHLKSALEAFPDEALETEDYIEAARFFNLCRSRGVTPAHIDLLICATAIRRKWAVFSLGADFQRYARILSLRLHSPGRAR